MTSSSSRQSTARRTLRKTLENRTSKTNSRRYLKSMTAQAILQKSVRYNRGGEPLEVVIPYGEFVEFIETYGLDLGDDEKQAIHEARADREAGRTENFVRLEDLEKELGI